MNDTTKKEEIDKIILMDFFAEWCQPCKIQDPIIEELKEKFGDKIEFKKIDVDKDRKFTDKYNIRAIPTLIIEKDGKIFEKYVGVTNLYVLEKKINEALK